jgi:FkbM family methyltransferase
MADARSRLKLAVVKVVTTIPYIGSRAHRYPVSLRIAELGGLPLRVRPGTTDLGTLVHDFIRFEHLPPPPLLEADLRQVCEFGSNVGTGLAGLAARYPSARVLGVEPDRENAALARANVAAFGDRCQVVEAAIWHRSDRLAVRGDLPSGYTVESVGETADAISGVTIDTLLADEMADGDIDYICFNLEGAEGAVLEAGGEWAARTRSVRCELHPAKGFNAERCVAALRALGFRAWAEPEDWGGWGFGLRPSVMAPVAPGPTER